MLEDPSYAEIVRWGDEGDSFVVLECEKFTKTILPKHFKHSNFASFVRQLNKYDFHKVRQNNEENGQSPYGQNGCLTRNLGMGIQAPRIPGEQQRITRQYSTEGACPSKTDPEQRRFRSNATDRSPEPANSGAATTNSASL
ncbi:unnamed protein product [Aspergillus oryzae RIB40]|uniref:DNA, SC003 n=2 Tax=Aspergillus oryzae TaxID=5062 RepID=Q2ULL6_ASPOR|nr:unnamed protein product [Aspergillus oryzae RIB40]EIT73445.1 heat shock transcription factor [Aspergillus oryzae 3.042]KDE78177.1 heat shock transcription factor [Aspergillus oryzae 100-8]BAE57549.1 unnamed protein product [Aspergillus oryzae RIB40]|eukprot:EIT73445.1 heat shock transcription factor [Aspergillus oryzae 3.042]